MPELFRKVHPVEVTNATLELGFSMQVSATCLPSWNAVPAKLLDPDALAALALKVAKLGPSDPGPVLVRFAA